MKIYIAGPMRGLPEWNFPAFDQAEALWRSAGHHPLSPAQTCRALGYAKLDEAAVDLEHLKHVMAMDIACIYAADGIALLPGWEESTGATVELGLAQFLRLPVYEGLTMERLSPPGRPWRVVFLLTGEQDASEIPEYQ